MQMEGKIIERPDGNMKNNVEGKLVDELEENDENENRDSVVKKLNTLRPPFRRDSKKVSVSFTSGAAPEDVYRPPLLYYEPLLFLHDAINTSSSSETVLRC